jgi:hypothetical protein
MWSYSIDLETLNLLHYLSLGWQHEALSRLQNAIIYDQPNPATPVGYSDKRWEVVCRVMRSRPEYLKELIRPLEES